VRVLFLSLLLVNVAFFAWEYRHPEPPPAAVARLDPGVPPVRLLRERAKSAPAGKTMSTPGGAPAVAPGAPSSTPNPGAGPASKAR
jgi:hypothetical protein